MAAAIVRRTDSGFVVQVEVPYKPSMLEAEEAIQDALNEAGVAATEEVLSRFDADGQPIRLGPVKLTSMGRVRKEYQTPYGVATVDRHVYQGAQGRQDLLPAGPGRPDRRQLHPPVRQDGRPQVRRVRRRAGSLEDLAENHGREVAKAFVQDVADAVAAVALAKEEDWEYELPELEEPVATVTVGLDGTCMLMCEDGWREAMVGTLGFYDKDGERLHTIYTAATPEYGKLTFFDRFDREIDRVKAAYPDALYVGLADGAKDNWTLPGADDAARRSVDFCHVDAVPRDGGRAAVRRGRRRGCGRGSTAGATG